MKPLFSELALDGPGVTVKAAMLRKAIRIPDTRKETGYVDANGRTGRGVSSTRLSELSVPVIVEGESAAVLNVESRKLGAFTEADQWLLETLASHAAMAFSRLRRDEALRRSEENMRALLNATTDVAILQDVNGTILAANEVFARAVRGKPEEIIGARAYDITQPDSEKTRKLRVDEVIRSGKPVRFEDERDGLWFDNNIHPILDAQGKVTRLAIFAKDITEYKRAEEALRKSEERYRYLFEESANVNIVIGVDGKIRQVNRAVAEGLGYSPEAIVGKDVLQLVVPEHRQKVASVLQKGFKDEPTPEVVADVYASGGLIRTMLFSRGHAMLKEKDQVTGILVTGMDITEQRLQQAEHLAAIGETAAMVGHDLRNPLQGIAGAAYLLQHETLAEEERNELLQLIHDCVKYSDGIVNELLDYSRTLQPALTETTPKEIITNALQAVQVPDKIEVQDQSQQQPIIAIDSDMMKRVFVNLIENAFDAMPRGGTLTIGSRQSNEFVEVTISDTGAGISKEAVENLWKPLQTTKSRGMGLGLSICRRIIDAHGGNVSVDSKPGKGTTFTVQLPIKSKVVTKT
jgi:PAS domain S-box-containing protein